jgi:hypothetical protein
VHYIMGFILYHGHCGLDKNYRLHTHHGLDKHHGLHKHHHTHLFLIFVRRARSSLTSLDNHTLDVIIQIVSQ